ELADALLARSLAMDPTSAWAWERSGWLKTYLGEPQTAIEHFRRSFVLDPSGPNNANRFTGIGSAHFDARRYEQAAYWFRKALPELPWPARTLACAYVRMGQQSAAGEALNAFLDYCPDATVGQVVGSIPFTADFLTRVAENLSDLGLPP